MDFDCDWVFGYLPCYFTFCSFLIANESAFGEVEPRYCCLLAVGGLFGSC